MSQKTCDHKIVGTFIAKSLGHRQVF